MTRGARPFMPAKEQNLFSLSRIFFGNTRTYIHVASDEAFCTARNEKHPECPEAMKYCICFSIPLNALSPAKTVECPRKLTNDSVSI